MGRTDCNWMAPFWSHFLCTIVNCSVNYQSVNWHSSVSAVMCHTLQLLYLHLHIWLTDETKPFCGRSSVEWLAECSQIWPTDRIDWECFAHKRNECSARSQNRWVLLVKEENDEESLSGEVIMCWNILQYTFVWCDMTEMYHFLAIRLQKLFIATLADTPLPAK